MLRFGLACVSELAKFQVKSHKFGTKMNPSSPRDQRRMYCDLAWTWPIISPPEDYVEESEQLAEVIRERSKIEEDGEVTGFGSDHIFPENVSSITQSPCRPLIY